MAYSAGSQFAQTGGFPGEHLGYLNGGFHQLIDALEKSIVRKGGVIRKQHPVSSVSFTRMDTGKQMVSVMMRLFLPSHPRNLKESGGPAMHPIPYQGAACMTLAIEREVTEGIYWLNMKDAAPYGAVVAHTNFITIQQIRGTYRVPGILLYRNSSSNLDTPDA